MRRLTSALLLCLFVLAVKGNAKDPGLSLELLHAKYVAVGFETAQGFVAEFDQESFTSLHIHPEDRTALNNVRDALEKWHRYIVTIQPAQAEMLIAVRAGRLASADGGVRIGRIPGTPGAGGGGIGPVFGGETGPPDDYLAVYQATDGHEGPRLWRKSEESGLIGKNPPLFVSFKDDVETLAKKHPSTP